MIQGHARRARLGDEEGYGSDVGDFLDAVFEPFSEGRGWHGSIYRRAGEIWAYRREAKSSTVRLLVPDRYWYLLQGKKQAWRPSGWQEEQIPIFPCQHVDPLVL